MEQRATLKAALMKKHKTMRKCIDSLATVRLADPGADIKSELLDSVATQLRRILRLSDSEPRNGVLTAEWKQDLLKVLDDPEVLLSASPITELDDIKDLTRPLQDQPLLAEQEKAEIQASAGMRKGAVTATPTPDLSKAPLLIEYPTLEEDRSSVSQKPGIPADVEDLIAQKTRDFVGRDYIFDAVEAFLKSRASGYLHIRGDPGAGKTTILAELVRRRACPAHFNIRAERRSGPAHFMKSLHGQLCSQWPLSVDEMSSTADLSHILQTAAAALRPDAHLLIVVDALDEVDPSGRNAGENILCLPSNLPDRVFVVLSSRRGVTVPLQVASIQQLDLSDFSNESLEDIKLYVERATRRPAILEWLRSRKFRPAFFVEALTEKSQGNFMYAFYVLHDVENGKYTDVSFMALPAGLENYYQMHWERMGMLQQPVDRNRLNLLYTLSQVRMPASRTLLADFSGLDHVSVQHTLDEWAQFLHRQMVDGEARWSIYHPSFSDFLERADIVQAAGVSLSKINHTITEQLLKDIHGPD